MQIRLNAYICLSVRMTNSEWCFSPSVFDREDDTSRSGGSLAALERRQAERKKEIMRAQTMPKSSASQARKAMMEKLDKDGVGWAEPYRLLLQKSQTFLYF